MRTYILRISIHIIYLLSRIGNFDGSHIMEHIEWILILLINNDLNFMGKIDLFFRTRIKAMFTKIIHLDIISSHKTKTTH